MLGMLVALFATSVPPESPTPTESARSAVAAAEQFGSAFPGEVQRVLSSTDDAREVWQTIAPHTLLEVEINPEMRVKIAPGRAKAELVAGERRAYFVRVDNRCGATARLAISATDLASVGGAEPEWLEVEIADVPGCSDRLSGAAVDYKLVVCRVKRPGRREARLGMDAGQGTQDLGFRGVTDVLFHVRPASQATKGD